MNCKHADYHSLHHYACCAPRFIAKLGNIAGIIEENQQINAIEIEI